LSASLTVPLLAAVWPSSTVTLALSEVRVGGLFGAAQLYVPVTGPPEVVGLVGEVPVRTQVWAPAVTVAGNVK
jgi:hypothetical protein